MPKSCEYCSNPLNKLQLSRKQRFCSRQCKSLSQIRLISVTCDGCEKVFSKTPCFKRSFNYCSIDCYWNSTRKKEIRNCKVCNNKFWATKTQINKGFGIFCSRSCQHKTYPEQAKKICPKCGRIYFVCRAWGKKRVFCSKKCQDDSMRDYVSRICRKCGNKFDLPRSDLNRGRGNFCTYKCFLIYRGPSALEEKMKRALEFAGINYEREVKFKRFRADFLIRRARLVIECDGEYWHMMPKIKNRDLRKDILLKSLGYKVLRFSGRMMDKYSEAKLAGMVARMYPSESKVVVG